MESDWLFVGDNGDGTVSGFIWHPLGEPGLLYFQSNYPWVWKRFHIPPSPPPFLPRLILFPLYTPRHHVPSIVPCSCCPRSLRSINKIITGVVDSGLCFPLTTTSSALCTVWCPPPSPVSLPQKTQDCPGDPDPANRCSSLKRFKPVLAPLPSQSWRRVQEEKMTTNTMMGRWMNRGGG